LCRACARRPSGATSPPQPGPPPTACLLIALGLASAAMSEWPRAVLFDFDGVIVNSEPLHFHAFHEVLREENIELTEAEYYAELLGFDDRGGFKYIFEKRG